jgi:beta-glucosidase
VSTAGERADKLLAEMSFEDKVAVALGDFDAVAHLGVPALRYADGPNGIRGPDNVTAFPAALALAATFDEGLAAEYGAAVAVEARDTGSNVLLGRAVDIARVPQGGRLPEAMGEDPYLAGRLAAAEVRAIQDGHVISMVKHFVGNNAETGRTGYATNGERTSAVNTVVSERALRELYYPPFKAVVQRGGAGSVMGSYNRLNGAYACQHPASSEPSSRSGGGTGSWPLLPARRARPGRGRQRRARHPRARRDRRADGRALHLRRHPRRTAGRPRPAGPVRHLRRRLG